jgi:hypothetical protein
MHINLKQKWILTAATAFLLLLPTVGCVHSIDSDIDVADAPEDDSAYDPILQKSTRTKSVFKDFENRYQIVTTYLSPEFRGAFSQRLTKVYMTGAGEFEEANSKAGFFVSLNAPFEDRTDLSNPQHWSVLMKTPDGLIKPVVVKKLTDKERWRAFFGSVNSWSHDYLIVFDAPGVNPASADLVEKTTINIVFANADGQVSLTW